jgi:hypothetical protein
MISEISRFVCSAVVSLIAIAVSAAGQASDSIPRRYRLYFPDTAREEHLVATQAANRKALVVEVLAGVARLKKDLQQITWVDDVHDADYWLTDFVIERDDPNVTLLAQFGQRPQQTARIKKRCPMCLAPDGSRNFVVRRMLMELVEESLFGEADGLYRPLPVLRCERQSTDVVLAEVKPANGIALEEELTYVAGHRLKNFGVQRSGVHLEVKRMARRPENAYFKVLASGEVRDNFMESCSSRLHEGIVLVPSLLPGLNSGTKNGNF